MAPFGWEHLTMALQNITLTSMACRFTLVLLFMSSISLAQRLKRDSILLYERAMDRPLTMHKGQLRTTSVYGLSLYNKRFNDQGNTVRLIDEGFVKVSHTFSLDVRYGLSDFVQFTTQIAFKQENQRGNEFVIVNDYDPSVVVQNKVETTGLEDLLIATELRAPFTPKNIDVVLFMGATLPTAKAEPSQPKHTVRNDVDFNAITYHYRNHWGQGVPCITAGLRSKFRAKNWAYSVSGEYWHPTKEGNSKSWKHQLYGLNFTYYESEYTYALPRRFNFAGEIEHQPLPWVAVSLGGDVTKYAKGWSTISSRKVQSNEARLISMSMGIELLVTHQLWLKQRFLFSLAGENQFAPFIIYTSLTYNLFP